MTVPTYAWVASRGAYVQAQADDVSTREQQYENSARVAYQNLTYTSTGVGQIVVPGPLKFDTVFGEPPAVVTGSVLIQAPKEGWQYPQCTAGVYRWLTNDKGYITGAYVYFNVRCDPVNPDDVLVDARMPLQDLQDRLAYLRKYPNFYSGAVSSSPTPDELRMQALEAKFSAARMQAEIERQQRLLKRGAVASPVVTHHLLFQGVAMKELPDSVTGEMSAW